MALTINSPDRPARYHLSGKLGRAPAALVAGMFVGGVIVGCLAGRASAHGDSIRFIFVSGLLLGAGLGYACFWAAQQLKCRNALLVQGAALLGGTAAAYCLLAGLAAELQLSTAVPATPVPDLQLLVDPPLLFRTLDTIANAGVILDARVPVSAQSLWTGWAMQALFLVGVAWFLARRNMLRQVFCEDCHKWLDISRKKLLLPAPSDAVERRRLEFGDLSVFVEQPLHRPIHASKPPFARVDYVLCGVCGNTGAFRIVHVSAEPSNALFSLKVLPWWMEESRFQEKNFTPLLQLTPDAAKGLGLLLARDKESKAPPARSNGASAAQPRKTIPIRKKKG